MSKKEFWDFDENKNYINVNIHDKNYKVINKYRDYYIAALILNYINDIIVSICKYFEINYYRYSNKDKLYIKCFLQIHPHNHLLSEMQLKTPFNGINKPRNIHITNQENIGKDGNLRAGYRHIFLTLRDYNGNFNNIDIIMKLVIHEIAHTMCNHVKWRDDDHNDDFKNAEKIIKNAYKNIKPF